MLLKCKKKPVIVEAMEITKESELEVIRWAGKDIVVPSPVLEPTEDNPSGSFYQIRTLEGIMTCVPGDFILRGVKGEFYPCCRSIFLEMYDIVESIINWSGGMSFGEALKAAKEGKRVARDGWSDSGAFVFYLPEETISELTSIPVLAGIMCPIRVKSHYDFFSPSGGILPGWVATSDDLRAEDWRVVE